MQNFGLHNKSTYLSQNDSYHNESALDYGTCAYQHIVPKGSFGFFQQVIL